MSNKSIIQTDDAPQAIGTYSQAVKAGDTVCEAAGGDLQDIVKLNIYMTDLANFATVNEVMATCFQEPYPARAAIEVSALPKGVPVEMDAVMVLS